MTNHAEPAPRNLTLEDFEPLEGQDFRIQFPEESFVLSLVEVAAIKHGHRPGFRTPFSLLFRCADQRILNQQLWPLHNDSLGLEEIFLVPIGQDAEGVTYEAVFN